MRRLALLPLIALAVLDGACAERGCLVIRQGQPLALCKPATLPGSPAAPVSSAPALTAVKVGPGESLWTFRSVGSARASAGVRSPRPTIWPARGALAWPAD